MARQPEVFVRALEPAEGGRQVKITRTARDRVRLRRVGIVLASVQGRSAGEAALRPSAATICPPRPMTTGCSCATATAVRSPSAATTTSGTASVNTCPGPPRRASPRNRPRPGRVVPRRSRCCWQSALSGLEDASGEGARIDRGVLAAHEPSEASRVGEDGPRKAGLVVETSVLVELAQPPPGRGGGWAGEVGVRTAETTHQTSNPLRETDHHQRWPG
jgi:hypothetical protein